MPPRSPPGRHQTSRIRTPTLIQHGPHCNHQTIKASRRETLVPFPVVLANLHRRLGAARKGFRENFGSYKPQITFVRISNALNIELRTRPLLQHLIKVNCLCPLLLDIPVVRKWTTSMIFEDGVDALINIFNTQTFV